MSNKGHKHELAVSTTPQPVFVSQAPQDAGFILPFWSLATLQHLLCSQTQEMTIGHHDYMYGSPRSFPPALLRAYKFVVSFP